MMYLETKRTEINNDVTLDMGEKKKRLRTLDVISRML